VIAGWDQETIFKILEATGILGQVFRCITQPPYPSEVQNHLIMMDNIMQCPVLVKKKLKPGQPTGDILANVIAGKDGYKGSRDKATMIRLENLQKMCSLFNEKQTAGKSCRNCNKGTIYMEFQNSLLVCRYVYDVLYV
jgi:hypothetical protein